MLAFNPGRLTPEATFSVLRCLPNTDLAGFQKVLQARRWENYYWPSVLSVSSWLYIHCKELEVFIELCMFLTWDWHVCMTKGMG